MVNKKQVVNNTEPNIIKKRGRKSKKELELNQLELEKQIKENNLSNQNNINVIIEDSDKEDITNDIANLLENINISDLDNNITDLDNNISDLDNNEIINDTIFLMKNEQNLDDDKIPPKKRGRKPKGGKIIQQVVLNDNNKEDKPNIILHLKCSLKDLSTNSLLVNDIQSYNFSSATQLSYNVINENNSFANKEDKFVALNKKYSDTDYENDNKTSKENDIRDIWKKLKILEHNLHVNNICDKKSACFWCTYDFDNPPVYIPKHNIKDTYHVYGCFCSPECATAYLMEEHIDSSSKFERYHLMNHIYTKIYNYNKNIKPAPNPYYMLDKYYGNLNIQEYRSLLRNERLFLVVDKPLTRILPELHEDNDDFIINNKIIPSNTYQVKKKIQKKTKNNILSEHFGLNQ
jgi:hypothetical protein